MMFSSLPFLAVLVGVVQGAAVEVSSQEAFRRGGVDVLVKERPKTTTCLLPEALQSASVLTGQEIGTSGIGPGQVESQTSVMSQGWKPKKPFG